MENPTILIQGTLKPFYPGVILWGKIRTNRKEDPFWRLEHVQFDVSSVSVTTVGSYSDADNGDLNNEVKVTVFKGIPESQIFSEKNICVAGVIKVGRKGLSLGAIPGENFEISWPKGESVVTVVLDIEEVKMQTVRNITFYIQHIVK